MEFYFWLLFHHGPSSHLLPDSPEDLDLNLRAALGPVPKPGISFPDKTHLRLGSGPNRRCTQSPLWCPAQSRRSVEALLLMGPLLSALVFQDLVTMVEQLARFLGVSCDKAQLESLIEHCHQLVDQCCNAEALPVGRGTRPCPGAQAQSPSCVPPPCVSFSPALCSVWGGKATW